MVDLALFLVVTAGSGLIGGSFMGWLVNWRLEQKFASIRGKLAVEGSASAFHENEAEMAAAMAYALDLHGQGRPIPEIIKEVALKHPAIAVKFAKMFLAGKIKLPANMSGIGGLFK